MPVRIALHTSFSALVEMLIPRLREGLVRNGSLGATPLGLVVPSTLVADWLQLQIAARLGVCMGVEFLRPGQFVNRILGTAETGSSGERASPWEQEQLRWRLLPLIRNYAARMGIREAGALSQRDCYALACLLADRFDQYGHFRPELLQAWNEDRPAPMQAKAPAATREAEGWQRELWKELQRVLPSSPEEHPAFAVRKLSAGTKIPWQGPVTVLGSGMLDPVLVGLLGVLADRGCDVAIFQVLPSLGYLADLSRSQAWSALSEDPELEIEGCGHPLAASLGRQSIGAFQLLGQLDEDYSAWPESAALQESEQARGSLLSRLQEDIRLSRPPQRSQDPFSPDDLSLKVHSCHSPRRELEVLRDELLRAFVDYPDLKPEEVLIVGSDLELYGALADPILARGEPPLPVRLTQLPLSASDPLAQGLLALLDMALSRQTASGLLSLLELPAVQGQLGIENERDKLDRIRSWVRRSGLTFARDARHRSALGLGEEETGTWCFASDRLLAGDWLGDEALATDAEGRPVLPLADELLGDEALRRAFILWVQTLARSLENWEQAAEPKEWASRLEQALSSLLQARDGSLVSETVGNLLEHLRICPCPTQLELATIRDWFSNSVSDTGARRLAIAGHIAFGRLNQLHTLPCRVLAMVGMQDTAFPRQNRTPAWDLLQLKPERWDRNLRDEDRQCFLDCLLAPTDRLIITASNRNARTNREEALSSCVEEVLRAAGHTLSFGPGGASEALVCIHALNPSNPSYFDGSGRLPPSFDAIAAGVATRLASSENERRGVPLFDGSVTEAQVPSVSKPKSIDIRELAEAWRNPSRAFLKASQIAIPHEEEDDLLLDSAPVTLDSLQAWLLKKEIVLAELSEKGSSSRLKLLRAANRGLPPARLGEGLWRKHLSQALELAETLRTLAGSRTRKELQIECGEGLLVRGDIEIYSEAGRGDFVLFWRPGRFEGKQGALLDPWINSLLASASGLPLPALLVDESSASAEPRICEPVPTAEAIARLRVLGLGCLEGKTRPLAYAPTLSASLAKQLEQGGEPDFQAAAEAWFRENEISPGEGTEVSAKLAWRDQDPFTPSRQQEWLHWAREIAAPLGAWSKGKEERT